MQNGLQETRAHVHSFQSLGAVDGPGLRYVVFLQGCPYRCPWCHNPDTRACTGGTEYTVPELVARAERYRTYFTGGGGVTLSGGEPLLQRRFAAAFFRALHGVGIHTALDTAGMKPDTDVEELLAHTDTVLCDLKFPDDVRYRKQIGMSLSDVLAFLALCERMGRSVTVRHVVVPTVTDSPDSIRRISELAHSVLSAPQIELLPFRRLCVPKYRSMGIPFPMEQIPECPDATVRELYRYL